MSGNSVAFPVLSKWGHSIIKLKSNDNNDRGPIGNPGLQALSYYPRVVRPIPLQMRIGSDKNLLTFADLLNG